MLMELAIAALNARLCAEGPMRSSSTQDCRRPSDVLVGREREFSELNVIVAYVAQSRLAP